MMKVRGSLVAALAFAGLVALPATALAAPPSHDDFDHAAVVDGNTYSSTQTGEATTATDDPQCENSNSHSVWYSYTAPDTWDITLDGGVNSDRSMVMAVYSGERGSLTELDCATTRSYRNATTATVPAGETVHIMVADALGGLGGYTEVFFHATPPPVDVEMTITKTGLIDTASGEAVVRGTLECSRDARLQIFGYVRQKQNHRTVAADFRDRMRCDEGDVELWVARAAPYRGTFIKGPASAEGDWRDLDGSDSSGNVDPTIYLKPCGMIGTPRSQRMQGTHRDETICALSGNDRVFGKGGNDKLLGGPGRDSLFGGDGNDVLTGGPGVGRNILDGGAGHDTCKKETKHDIVRNCEVVE
jgi:hypothetical protein